MRKTKATRGALKVLADPGAHEEEWLRASVLVPEQKSLPAYSDAGFLNLHFLSAVIDSLVNAAAGYFVILLIQLPIVFFLPSICGFSSQLPVMLLPIVPIIFGLTFGMWSERFKANTNWLAPVQILSVAGLMIAACSTSSQLVSFWGVVGLAVAHLTYGVGRNAYRRLQPFVNPWTTMNSALTPISLLFLGTIIWWQFFGSTSSPIVCTLVLGAACLMAMFTSSMLAGAKCNSDSALTKTTISLLPVLPLILGLISAIVFEVLWALISLAYPHGIVYFGVPWIATPACIASTIVTLLVLISVSTTGGSTGRSIGKELQKLQMRKDDNAMLNCD